MPTPSPEKIQRVLDDLYELDPTLRTYGAELERTVATILAARPEMTINPQFVSSLRKRLMQTTPQSSSVDSLHSPSPIQQIMKKISSAVLFPVGAIAAVAVIAAVVVSRPEFMRLLNPASPTPSSNSMLARGVVVTQTGANAFGALGAPGAGSEGDLGSPAARSQSGGGGTAYGMGGGAPPVAPMPPVADGADPANMAKMSESAVNIMPADYTYERIRYTYDGPELTLATQGDVYRRVKRSLDAGDLGSVLGRLSLGVLDLSRFGNVNLQQFSLVQPGEYGYQIYVDMAEGNVNINQNWATWPQQSVPCLSATVTESMRMPCNGVRAEDVPEDAALITIADTFLSEHGISKEGYAAPVVDRRWIMAQPLIKAEGQAADDAKRLMYVPESVTVMYPLQFNGEMLNDQSGFPYGLSVSVDVRSKRVSNVWNLTTREYQASSYDLVTDVKKVLDIASRGDVYSQPFGQDPNERIRDLKLGEPTTVLMQSWHQKDDGTGEEIYVPALRFPVIADADGYMGYRDAVVIPLVKDLMEPVYSTMGGSGGTMEKLVQPNTAVTPPAPAAVSNPPKGDVKN